MFSAFAREYQLPVTLLLLPAVSCPACIGRIEDEEEEEVVCVKEVLPPVLLKQRAAHILYLSVFTTLTTNYMMVATCSY